MENEANNNLSSIADDTQYSLTKILSIWALVAIPMPILMFIVAPALADPSGPGYGYAITVWLLMIAGMIWQFVLSMIILYRELDAFTWANIKKRVWLSKPTDPKTGKSSYKYFWWLIPAAIFVLVIEMSPVGDMLVQIVLSIFPSLDGIGADIEGLAIPELVGAWWLLGVAIVSIIFNYFLGEELLFRGILLPKMKGAFGKWDWIANAALFGMYHLHKPQHIITISVSALAYTWTSKRFQSNWFAIILHGVEGIIVLVAVIGVASGLAF